MIAKTVDIFAGYSTDLQWQESSTMTKQSHLTLNFISISIIIYCNVCGFSCVESTTERLLLQYCIQKCEVELLGLFSESQRCRFLAWIWQDTPPSLWACFEPLVSLQDRQKTGKRLGLRSGRDRRYPETVLKLRQVSCQIGFLSSACRGDEPLKWLHWHFNKSCTANGLANQSLTPDW